MKLKSIEAARGIAALMVVAFHGERALSLPQYVGHMPLGGLTAFMHTGVDFFFVLSGYIIFTIHRRDIGHPNTIAWEVLRFSLSVPFATHIAEPRRRGVLAH